MNRWVLTSRPVRPIVSDHLYELVVAWGLLTLLLGPLERLGETTPGLVPWQFLSWALVMCSIGMWMALVRPRQLDAQVRDGDLLIRNFWRRHVVPVAAIVEVRHVRGRSAFPLVGVVTVAGREIVIESADFRDLDHIAGVLQTGSGSIPLVVPSPYADELLFEEMGYNAAGMDRQLRDFASSVLDGSWFLRLVRIY